MAGFPEKAKVVIVGLGGIVGAAVAHHLIQRGWDDIVGIDKSGVPTDIGSTAHASDFCYMTSHDFLSLLDLALLDRVLREARPLRAHRRPRGRARRRRCPHGRDQAQDRVGQGLRHPRAPDRPGRDQAEVPADRREHGAGRPVGPRRRPGHPALADRRRQADRPGRDLRQAQGVRQHPGQGADHRERPHQGREDRPRHHHGRLCGGVRRPVGPPDRRDGGRGSAGHAGRPSPHLLRAVYRVRRHRQGDRLPAAARPGQLRLHARHRRSDHLGRRHDRVGLLRGEEPAPVPSARHPRKGAGAPVALAARPRHGADPRAAGARDRADADPGRARLQRAALVQRPAAGDRRRRPLDRRKPEGARPVVRRRDLGQGRARAWPSWSPTG